MNTSPTLILEGLLAKLFEKEFGGEMQAKQEADKTIIKYKEIIENANKKKEDGEEKDG